MKAEHAAIMARAKKEGLLPMELASELLVHDLVQVTRAQMCRYEVGYKKMTESQQDAVLAELQDEIKKSALIAAQVIASAGTETVLMTLKDMKVANGTVTGIVKGDEKYFNELISKVQDKSDVLIVLYQRQYADALDNIQSEKDQRSLPLDGAPKKTRQPKAKAGDEPKAIDIPQKLFADALEFINRNQVCTVASLQNGLHIGFEKGQALLAKLESEGIVTAADESGNRRIVKITDKPAGDEVEEIQAMYDKAREFIVKHQTVSVSALATLLDSDKSKVDEIISRLESDGVISAPGEDGSREVFEQ